MKYHEALYDTLTIQMHLISKGLENVPVSSRLNQPEFWVNSLEGAVENILQVL